MTGTATGRPQGAGQQQPRQRPAPLSLRHVPAHLDDEPAYRDDPIMSWSHKPEAPPPLRLGSRPWPPPRRAPASG